MAQAYKDLADNIKIKPKLKVTTVKYKKLIIRKMAYLRRAIAALKKNNDNKQQIALINKELEDLKETGVLETSLLI